MIVVPFIRDDFVVPFCFRLPGGFHNCYNKATMAKFQAMFSEMIQRNKELFDSFTDIHQKYSQDKKAFQNQFNEIGEKVVDTIHDYEKMLCSKSDLGGYGRYSTKLAYKFWEEVRKNYPLIDFVGVK